MGPKHNLVHFKSLLGWFLKKTRSSSQQLYAGKTWRVIPSLLSHLVFHFTLVNKLFRFGWQDWWGHSGISLILYINIYTFISYHIFETMFWNIVFFNISLLSWPLDRHQSVSICKFGLNISNVFLLTKTEVKDCKNICGTKVFVEQPCLHRPGLLNT